MENKNKKVANNTSNSKVSKKVEVTPKSKLHSILEFLTFGLFKPKN